MRRRSSSSSSSSSRLERYSCHGVYSFRGDIMTIYEVVGWYIKAKRARWAPRTLEQYEYLHKTYCSHEEIDAATIELCYNNLLCVGRERTAQLVYKLIRAACRRARRYRLISEDPTEYLEPVEHKQKMIEYWSMRETRAFLEATRGSEMHLAWELMLYLGLRRGELLGLRWRDVDFNECVIHIRNQRYRYNGELVDAPPKSRTSIRSFEVPEFLIKEMRQHQRLHPWSVYVVPSDPDELRKLFRNAVKQANLRVIPLHGLRHTFATNCVEAGIPLRVIQTMMGHATYAITEQHYAHVTPSAQRKALGGLAEAMASDS